LDRASETGLAQDANLNAADPAAALDKLDAWLCDLKEMRIGDGLHIFGRAAPASVRDDALAGMTQASPDGASAVAALFDACPAAETAGILAALDGRFVPPGPA